LCLLSLLPLIYRLSLFSFSFFFYYSRHLRRLHSFPTRRSSDLGAQRQRRAAAAAEAPRAAGVRLGRALLGRLRARRDPSHALDRSEEHTSELQSRENLVCRLLLEKKKNINIQKHNHILPNICHV